MIAEMQQPTMNNIAVEDWLRVHRQLIAAEIAFTDKAMEAVQGHA